MQPRNQASRLLRILSISFPKLLKHHFLFRGHPYQNHPTKYTEIGSSNEPIGGQQQHANTHKKNSSVHRVPYKAIWACGNQGVILTNLKNT